QIRGGRADLLYFHGRRGVSRVPRGQEAARGRHARGARGALAAAAGLAGATAAACAIPSSGLDAKAQSRRFARGSLRLRAFVSRTHIATSGHEVMFRRTKIVATLGPATDDPKVLERMIEAGLDVIRLNFSHGRAEVHLRRAEQAREIARAHGRHIGVLVDLQGPKIRIGRFKEGRVELLEGEPFVLDADLPLDAGTAERVGVTYKALPQDVDRGATLLLDDGRVVLWVERVIGNEIHCRVVVGGELSDSKGINRQGGGLSAKALTEKDREDIKTAAEMRADYLAVSFPRSAADIHEARELFRAAGGRGGIVAKIERAEAVAAIAEITQAAEAVMIARGDLAVEIGDADVPPIQKRIIRVARRMNKVVITATQMMESMIENA